jgi:hypothetical protein
MVHILSTIVSWRDLMLHTKKGKQYYIQIFYKTQPVMVKHKSSELMITERTTGYDSEAYNSLTYVSFSSKMFSHQNSLCTYSNIYKYTFSDVGNLHLIQYFELRYNLKTCAQKNNWFVSKNNQEFRHLQPRPIKPEATKLLHVVLVHIRKYCFVAIVLKHKNQDFNTYFLQHNIIMCISLIYNYWFSAICEHLFIMIRSIL